MVGIQVTHTHLSTEIYGLCDCDKVSRFSLIVQIFLLTSSPVTDSTLRLFFILIGSFWAPGRSVPEPRQQSRWRARTGEVRGHCKVKPGSDRVTTGPHWSGFGQPTASLALPLHLSLQVVEVKLGGEQ